jgi:hypothetical protein
MKTPEELLKNRIIRYNKPINRAIYALQLVGFGIPLFLSLEILIFYQVILFMAYEYMNELYKKSILSSIKVLAETSKMLNKRI